MGHLLQGRDLTVGQVGWEAGKVRAMSLRLEVGDPPRREAVGSGTHWLPLLFYPCPPSSARPP